MVAVKEKITCGAEKKIVEKMWVERVSWRSVHWSRIPEKKIDHNLLQSVCAISQTRSQPFDEMNKYVRLQMARNVVNLFPCDIM